MPQGRLTIEQDARPDHALAVGAALAQTLSQTQPLALYAATLQGAALVLGRYQRVSQALPRDSAGGTLVLRRSSGGSTVHAGSGISYIALALHERSVLMKCPAQRLLNRNVRGALQGLRMAGVPANYFGRDFLSFEARPAVYVGWDEDEAGRVLLEFFVSDSRSCWLAANQSGYPARKEDVLRARLPTTLEEAEAHARGTQALEKIAEGYAKGFNASWLREPSEPSAVTVAAPVSEREELAQLGLSWSPPLEEAIGFVSAGVSLDAAGKFSAVRLAGDFFAHRGCGAALERMLIGVTPTTDGVGRAVDAAYAASGHDVEGVRSMRSLQESILDAVGAAEREAEV
jgi:hypothetical protein